MIRCFVTERPTCVMLESFEELLYVWFVAGLLTTSTLQRQTFPHVQLSKDYLLNSQEFTHMIMLLGGWHSLRHLYFFGIHHIIFCAIYVFQAAVNDINQVRCRCCLSPTSRRYPRRHRPTNATWSRQNLKL